MNQHDDIRYEYEKIKIELSNKYRNDRIIVFVNGHVIELGNHKTLVESDMQYALMYKVQ